MVMMTGDSPVASNDSENGVGSERKTERVGGRELRGEPNDCDLKIFSAL